MGRIKNHIGNLIYQIIQKLYIRLSNKRSGNLIRLKDCYDYTVNPKFKGCNISITNPVECVYFALLQVYGGLSAIRLQGIIVAYDNNEIQVTIHTQRPGMIIGFRGKDIDELNLILEKYFNKPVKVNLIEMKDKFFIYSL